eukprot:761423-Hanusia_phi.AAC.1
MAREKSVRHLVNFLQADTDYLLPADKTRKKDSEETFAMKCNKFLSQLWPNIVNDDERSYACIPLYIVGWKVWIFVMMEKIINEMVLMMMITTMLVMVTTKAMVVVVVKNTMRLRRI